MFAAGGAETFGLDGGAADREADTFRRCRQRLGKGVVLEFGDAAAMSTNQELGGVVVRVAVLLDAADECGETLDSVHKALFLQKFQGAIDGRWGSGAAAFAQAVEQLVGAGGGGGVKHQPEHLATQAGQPDAALLAYGLGAIEQFGGAGREAVGHASSFARGVRDTR